MVESVGHAPNIETVIRSSVADIGSGNGYFTFPTAELVDGAPVYAIDVDEELLAELSATANTRGLANTNNIPVTLGT